MNKKLLLIPLLGFIIFYSLYSYSNKVSLPANYATKVAESRKKSLDYFKTNSESPFTDTSLVKNIRYFEIDTSLVVNARFEKIDAKNDQSFTMTDGTLGDKKVLGYVLFELQGKKYKLLSYDAGEEYFIPFQDATSGQESYGGGRYLNIKVSEAQKSTFLLDFNTAYNPYCVYNHTYSCPVPPAQNTIQVPIKAGEKVFLSE